MKYKKKDTGKSNAGAVNIFFGKNYSTSTFPADTLTSSLNGVNGFKIVGEKAR